MAEDQQIHEQEMGYSQPAQGLVTPPRIFIPYSPQPSIPWTPAPFPQRPALFLPPLTAESPEFDYGRALDETAGLDATTGAPSGNLAPPLSEVAEDSLPQSAFSSPANAPLTIRERASRNTKDGHNNGKEEKDPAVKKAAAILMDLHKDDRSLNRINPNLLTIPGRSGLRSRGVKVGIRIQTPAYQRTSSPESTRRQQPEDDSLDRTRMASTPADNRSAIGIEDSDSSSELTSLEDLEDIDDVYFEEDEEYVEGRRNRRPTTRKSESSRTRARSRAIDRATSRRSQSQRASSGPTSRKRKTSRRSPIREYKRFDVRDQKGRFTRKSDTRDLSE